MLSEPCERLPVLKTMHGVIDTVELSDRETITHCVTTVLKSATLRANLTRYLDCSDWTCPVNLV